jgi:hypothetical protein
MARQQLEVYAGELHKHFPEERRLRKKLEERYRHSEQRTREIEALNRLTRQELERHLSAVEADQAAGPRLERLAQEAGSLAELLRSQPSSSLKRPRSDAGGVSQD